MGEEVLADKLRAPLAAAVATVLLLKGNRFDLMHDWARNVGNWFPTIPDGVVVWTDQLRRMAVGRPLPPDLLPWFVHELSRRSLPFTADGFGLAADLVTDIVRGRLQTDAATRDAARELGARIDAAAPYSAIRGCSAHSRAGRLTGARRGYWARPWCQCHRSRADKVRQLGHRRRAAFGWSSGSLDRAHALPPPGYPWRALCRALG